MKIDNFLTFAAVVCLFAGCTITGKIARQHPVAAIEHVARPLPKSEEKPAEPSKGYIEYVDKNNETHYFIPTADDGIATIRIKKAVVVAPSRTIPERNGKVALDFVVTLPRELLGNCRGVEVTPILHRDRESIPLQELAIRGALFNKVQERNYWQYDRYIGLFNPDESGAQWAYDRFIHYPYPEGTRLDSVAHGKANVTYFYTQEVPTTETEGNKLLITLQGRVVALDHSEYRFPLSDTLTYRISSMLQFADTTTRYITRVVEKYAVINDRNYLNFPVNKSEIIDTLSDNSAQLSKIEKLMDEILNQREFYVDSITLTASASPEGSIRKNDALARSRAYSLRDRLAKKFHTKGIDTLIKVRWVGEDWDELSRLISDDKYVENREKIVELISEYRGVNSAEKIIRTRRGYSAPKCDLDALENEIKSKFPSDYNYIFSPIYPRLRAVDFRYNLRRVGMIKDTIHTTTPDTLYARGVALLHARKYRDALAILGGFRDRNAAICHLSLGQDLAAYQILKSLPEHSVHEYLLSVTCMRLSNKIGEIVPDSSVVDVSNELPDDLSSRTKSDLESEAITHFARAIELDPSLEHRAKLDPEISSLIKKYSHEKAN